jgi:hypothetical protein
MCVMAAGVSTWQHSTLKFQARPRLAQHQRGGRRGGLEADGEEHHLALGVLVGQGQGVGRRIDHADVGPAPWP